MLESKEFHIKLANTCNLMYKQNRQTNIEDAYKVLTGTRWPYTDIESEQYADFVSCFIENIAEAGIRLFSKLSAPNGRALTLKCLPKKVPISKKQGAFSLKFLKDKNNKYKEIGVIEEQIYGTNGSILLRLCDERWKKYSGKVIPFDLLPLLEAGIPVEIPQAPQPRYKSILFPKNEMTHLGTVDLTILLEKVYGALFMFDSLWSVASFFCFYSKKLDTKIYFEARNLFTLLQVLVVNGAKKGEIYYHPQGYRITFYADNGNLGVIMRLPYKEQESVIVEDISEATKKEGND